MQNRQFSRLLSALTLLVWSAVLLYFYCSGRLNEYLVSVYRPFVAVAGFLMLGLAGLMLVGLRRENPATPTLADDLALPRRSRAMQIFAFLVLVLPVASAVAVSSDSFSSSVVQHRGLVTDGANLPGGRLPTTPSTANAPAEPPLPGQSPAAADDTKLDVSQYLQTTPDGHLLVSVFDLLMAAPDDTLRPDFEGRTVELIGQYLPDTRNHADGSRFNLVRMYMVCCAADARPIAVSVEPPPTTTANSTAAAAASKPADMAWVKVVGKVQFPVENGTRTAVIRAESVAPSDPPAEVMLY